MVLVGGIDTINGSQAKRVVAQPKPRRYVLPADEFLDDQPSVQKRTDTSELVIPMDARPEQSTVVVLGWKQADAPAKPKK